MADVSRELTLNELPAHSPWPARLLGAAEFTLAHKTPAELEREYEGEKWGPLLERYRSAGGGDDLETVKRWSFELGGTTVCSSGDRLELMPTPEARSRHFDWVHDVLRSLLPARGLVELGCGFGQMILSLAAVQTFRGLRFAGGEFARSGVELMRLLAEREGLDVATGHSDFLRSPVADFDIPERSIIFTSYATVCVPQLPRSFVEWLLERSPQAVVHFEPCLEHCDPTTMLGLMRMRYLTVNDYNRNLLTLLESFEDEGRLEIVTQEAAVYGVNALCPASLIVWRPAPGELETGRS